MLSHPLDYLNNFRAWEVILVTSLSLCSLFVVVFFFSSLSLSIIVLGKLRFSLLSVTRGRLRVELELRKSFASVLMLRKIDYSLDQNYEKITIIFAFTVDAIVFCNFDYEFFSLVLMLYIVKFAYFLLVQVRIFEIAFVLLIIVWFQSCGIISSRFPISFHLSVAIMNDRVS